MRTSTLIKTSLLTLLLVTGIGAISLYAMDNAHVRNAVMKNSSLNCGSSSHSSNDDSNKTKDNNHNH
ncbi:MAG TPA: hypothetical protein DD381_13350 [Lentisphaeria bacterium]|nr:MAG: hypothetical protein A2X47_11035 [Lentisphaerae bacterium GWF2_38_69]HBM17307.1 hypothetical protein [Lentisphaeria bacterium]